MERGSGKLKPFCFLLDEIFYLMTFSTVGIVVLRKELPIQLLLAAVTSEALFVEDLTKGGAAVICEVSLAVIAAP